MFHTKYIRKGHIIGRDLHEEENKIFFKKIKTTDTPYSGCIQ